LGVVFVSGFDGLDRGFEAGVDLGLVGVDDVVFGGCEEGHLASGGFFAAALLGLDEGLEFVALGLGELFSLFESLRRPLL
jgi:hypothetical protein